MQRSKHRPLFTVFSLVLSVILLAAIMVANRPTAAQSTMFDLGTLGGSFSAASAINNHSQVVGWSEKIAGSHQEHAFLWENGLMTDLGVLPGGFASRAYAINDNGQVAGSADVPVTLNEHANHAFLWENGVMTDLGTLGGLSSEARGINNNGQVAGVSETSDGDTHVFLWQNGVMRDLGKLPGAGVSDFITVGDVNNFGQIVGTGTSRTIGGIRAFRWENDVFTDLGLFLSGDEASVNAINDKGQLVGRSGENPGPRAFLWQDGILDNLGILGPTIPDNDYYGDSVANAINSAGQIVGQSTTDFDASHAFRWQGDTMTDLGTLGGNESGALGINDAGEIVGSSDTSQGQTHAFIITTNSFPYVAAVSGSVIGLFEENPIANALVQVCPVGSSSCATTTTDDQGHYFVTGLSTGDYAVTAFPPPTGPVYLPNSIGPLSLVSGINLAGQQIRLDSAPGFPPGTSISPAHDDGIPAVYFGDVLQLVTHGCAGGTASYTVSGDNFARDGALTEGPAGEYQVRLNPFFPNHGYATVSITIQCPDGSDQNIDFAIYIDPSGTVRTIDGVPLAGATVTLFRSDSAAGPFEQVPDGDPLMSPVNRANPDTTDAEGHFGWDVIAGFYKVRAEKEGCLSPSDPAQPFVESAVLTIPPPVTDLDLRLSCGSAHDTTPPAITIDAPADGSTYLLYQAVAASYSCTDDGGSGVATCAGPVADGANVDTGAVGLHSFTVNATDEAGNPSSASATYNVVYDFSGFFAPIANLPALNTDQAGRTIPVKFSLHGDQGPAVMADGYPKLQQIACDTGAPIGSAESIATARPSGLNYDAGADRYAYNWKTDKAWAGSCRQLVVRLIEDTEHRANFVFKR